MSLTEIIAVNERLYMQPLVYEISDVQTHCETKIPIIFSIFKVLIFRFLYIKNRFASD
jgi:hypothetical protein